MKAMRAGLWTAWVVLWLGIGLHANPTLQCGANLGTQFNLEPAANAVPQQLEVVDFIANRVALNQDLVVGGAFDSRGVTFASANATTPHWDASVGGYYVRRSSAAGCAPQFEGGLPVVEAGGNSFTSNGGVAVAADPDPARDAFFVADLRFSASDSGLSAIGLFRASSATLLNTTLCPNGTHTAAQAKSCWTTTPPAVIDPIPSGGEINALDYPSIAVDERASGTGAGDVYVAFDGSNGQGGVVVNLVSCTSLLSCSVPVIISARGENVAFNGTEDAYVQVRPDGKITVTYLDQTNQNETSPVEIIKFVTCQPRGAPTTPVCGAPTVVAKEAQTISTFDLNQALSSENFFAFTNVRHAHRLEADGQVTTFVVWDRCAEYFTFIQNPNPGQPALCLNADVVMSTSTNGGKAWSATTAVNADPGHQFFPSISTDDSTGTVNIVYYDTEQDFLHKRMVVALNQIAAGTKEVGAPIWLTTTPIPWDADPNQTALPVDDFDFHLGVKARGMGTSGFSRVYVSFTSTGDRKGIYKGQSLPEQNNNLQELLY